MAIQMFDIFIVKFLVEFHGENRSYNLDDYCTYLGCLAGTLHLLCVYSKQNFKESPLNYRQCYVFTKSRFNAVRSQEHSNLENRVSHQPPFVQSPRISHLWQTIITGIIFDVLFFCWWVNKCGWIWAAFGCSTEYLLKLRQKKKMNRTENKPVICIFFSFFYWHVVAII